jgi:hypothetical protein
MLGVLSWQVGQLRQVAVRHSPIPAKATATLSEPVPDDCELSGDPAQQGARILTYQTMPEARISSVSPKNFGAACSAEPAVMEKFDAKCLTELFGAARTSDLLP